MHTIQQIRVLWRGRATRCAVHLAAQRRQREDLRIPLVLVRHTRYSNFHHPHLPSYHNLLTAHARLHDEDALQARAKG